MMKTKTAKEPKKAPAPDKQESTSSPDGGWRETVESIAMAVILALLFRGYVAEAFVIPTGSMAPTLVGRHKDIQCPQCGQWYQVSGSEEQREERITGEHVYSTTCPICRHSHLLDPIERPNEGSFSGDRIIVGKFAYDFTEPKRWDVIVFKFPGNAVQNYIKRLIGLPGERVRIVGGNIYTSGNDATDDALTIARKPPHKLNTLLQLVDDTDHIPKTLIDVGWPSRWQSLDGSAWQILDGGRSLTCKGDQQQEAWIRYRH
jgi:signal peptidase I